MSADRTPDQGQSSVPQQEVASKQGLKARVTSLIRPIVDVLKIASGKHEQSGVVDPTKINPFSKQEPQPSQKFPPGETSNP